MIALPQIDPDEAVLEQLATWQALVDGEPGYAEQVARAQREWILRNRKGNVTFDEVRALLTEMCCGGRRCMYCEDSLADEVEHIWPKGLYPGLVFSWLNYLYTCGSCNREKGSRFKLTPSGLAILIDPRREDPMALLHLDLRQTFRLLPAPGLPAPNRERAEYTRRLLPLNSDALVKQRRAAYGHYRARLTEYIQHRAQRTPAPRLNRLRGALRRLDHPTVWREMQRQHRQLPELTDLFAAAPEALGWT
jgi:uncharacterized protein (TIGR02646 family)